MATPRSSESSQAEAAIFAANQFTSISFLWYNVIGCLVVIATALSLSVRSLKA